MITSTVTGNVGKQPELITTKTGKPMVRFSLASTFKKEGSEPATTWVDVTCFDEQATVVSERVNKGDRVTVIGRMQLETYDKKDGSEGHSLRIIADEVGLSLRFPKRETQPVAEPW